MYNNNYYVITIMVVFDRADREINGYYRSQSVHPTHSTPGSFIHTRVSLTPSVMSCTGILRNTIQWDLCDL